MDLDDYQRSALTTALPAATMDMLGVAYCTLGLNGEAGEIAERVKKNMRDGTTLVPSDIKLELGDVLWYLAVLADNLGISLNDVAQSNLAKLQSRKDRGMLQGSGDYR